MSELNCPHCKHVIEDYICVDCERSSEFSPGDMAVCSNCVKLCVVTDDGEFRKATDAEINEAADELIQSREFQDLITAHREKPTIH